MLSNSVSFLNKKLCRAEVFSGILTNLPKEPGHNQIKQLKRKLVTRKGCFRSKKKKKINFIIAFCLLFELLSIPSSIFTL